MINILIVDDHLIVREGIKRIIDDSADMSVVAEASCGMEALGYIWKYKLLYFTFKYQEVILSINSEVLDKV